MDDANNTSLYGYSTLRMKPIILDELKIHLKGDVLLTKGGIAPRGIYAYHGYSSLFSPALIRKPFAFFIGLAYEIIRI